MKYVYTKFTKPYHTHTINPLEYIKEDEEFIYAKPLCEDSEVVPFNKKTKLNEGGLRGREAGSAIMITYEEYVTIVNGKIEAQLEILEREDVNRQRAYNATKKELYAKMLPMDEVTE